MAGTFSRKLHVWENTPESVHEVYPLADSPQHSGNKGIDPQAGSIEQLYIKECLVPPGHRRRHKEQAEPLTLQWYLSIETQRYGRFGAWLPRILEFNKHAGETLLALGQGLGTDWAQYARNSVSVVACSPSTEQLALIRRNFELRNLRARYLHSQPHALPLESASVDVVAVNALHQAVDAVSNLGEIYRVLKPGGKVLVIATSRYDVDFWVHKVLIWRNWLGLNRRAYDSSLPRYSRRDLSRMFSQYVDQRTHRRQLRRSEVPHGWRWLPLPVLTRIAGRVVVLKAFKPLSIVLPMPAAA
jgi:ubiquinone/menaquinone biosynthesis C-methylase UbiE